MTIRLTSLQKITDLKNRMTQQASLEYAESLHKLETERDKLQGLLDNHNLMIHELHERTNQGVASQELHAWMQYMMLQRSSIEKQNLVILKKQQDCTEKRNDLNDRFLDEQKWLKLQERREMEHRAHLNKVAQEALDEIAVTGHRRVRG